MKKLLALNLVLMLGLVSSAWGLSVVDGTITDWGIRPFTDWTPNANISYIVEDNTSPVNYPGIGYVPSPGGPRGERFDFEALYWRRTGDDMQLLLISSLDVETYDAWFDYTYRIGDLMIDTDSDGTYELALITHNFAGHDFSVGALYQIDQTEGILTGHGGYGGYPGVAAQVNPWILKSGTLLHSGQLLRDNYNYGGLEAVTYMYEWTIPYETLNLSDTSTPTFHITVECGNDVIEGVGTPTPPSPVIPEPMSLSLAAAAVASLAGYARSNRRKPRSA